MSKRKTNDAGGDRLSPINVEQFVRDVDVDTVEDLRWRAKIANTCDHDIAESTTSDAGRAERPAQPGELCTCGRAAVVVYLTARGQVGHCGLQDVPQLRPCRFCGVDVDHVGPCPEYAVRPVGGAS